MLHQFLLCSRVLCVYISVIHIYIYPLFLWISFPFRLPQSVEQSSLCYTVGSHQLSVLYIVVYICQSHIVYISQSQIHPTSLPFLVALCLLSTSMSHFCFANKFICTIFLDSTYKHYYVFFFLTYLILYDSLQVRPCLCKETLLCSFV